MGPAFVRIWNGIPQASFNTLVVSMRQQSIQIADNLNIVSHMMMSSIILATTNCTSEYVIYKKINKTENTFYSIKFHNV
jgi:hypothetical protein